MRSIKGKNNQQMTLHQTIKLLHNKGHHQQNERVSYSTEDHFCKPHLTRGEYPKYAMDFHNSIAKINNSIKNCQST